MRRNVLLDTGPLVALINRRDQHHDWVQSRFAEIEPPLLTCEAVLTEACYLVRGTASGTQAILELVKRGVVRVAFALDAHVGFLSSLIQQYANIPMSLADACLVRMSELAANSVIFTLDSDFQLYRRHRRQKIPLLIPPSR